jgi:glutamate N-acetyltransferase/amino-acid N-acetyltransferase
MPVNLQAPDPAALHPVPGVRIGTAMAGVRKANRRDLVLFALDEGSVGGRRLHAATASAPRRCRSAANTWPRARHPRAGHQHRQRQCRHRRRRPGAGAPHLRRGGALMGLSAAQVLPFSTGVIMETLPVERIEAGLPAALADLQPGHWAERRRHHDHRHAAQGGVAPGADRRQAPSPSPASARAPA